MITYNDEMEYSEKISQLRYCGNISEAIKLCIEATERFSKNNFYYKLLGDLYIDSKDYEKSSNAYLEFLFRISGKKWLFKNFVRYFEKLIKSVDAVFIIRYLKSITEILHSNQFPIEIVDYIETFLKTYNYFIYASEPGIILLIDKLKNDKNFNSSVESIKQILQNNDRAYIEYFLKQVSHLEYTDDNKRTIKYIVSVLEKEGFLQEAIKTSLSIIKHDKDSIIVRSLFRICRKIDDYSEAQKFYESNPLFFKGASSFNILYELVYYFNYMKDQEMLAHTLITIKRMSAESLPINQTLYNFYLQFGMFNEAKEIGEHIQNLKQINVSKHLNQGKRFVADRAETIEETGWGLFETVSELISEREHNRQLLAMKDLVKGFSHELGQPITNIRYMIQYYMPEIINGKVSKEELNDLLNRILFQTERMGTLISRFAPLTSSKSQDADFDIVSRIKLIFDSISIRLQNESIEYNIESNTSIMIFGDPVKFDQVILNLINNSIHGLENKNNKIIQVKVSSLKNNAVITFEDNGFGIPKQIQRKIFEPFYTTKDPGKGEGLGLFIVWNILKMFDANITLDKNYFDGARFIIKFPLRKVEKDE